MAMKSGDHYPTCRADYPEKPEYELPQQATRIDLGDGEWVDQCVDCGAVLAYHFVKSDEDGK